MSSGPGLEVRNIFAGYGGSTILRDVSFSVPSGSVVAMLGPNGAGKTTTLRVISGLLRCSAGSLSFDGKDVGTQPPYRRARAGICMIPEGRGIFRTLTVSDNLRLLSPPKNTGAPNLDMALDVFPALRDRLSQTAGTMSGGQQQMLALARAYLSSAKIILLDEVSMGLSPLIVEQIYVALRSLASSGVSLLLVEQYVARALEIASSVVLMNRGAVSFNGPADLLSAESVAESYLGDGSVAVKPS